MEKYFCIGKKWFDKVNGNTYNNAKVIDENGKTLFYVGFGYGYGHHYFDRAKAELIKIDPDAELIDLGATNDLKRVLKNNLF